MKCFVLVSITGTLQTAGPSATVSYAGVTVSTLALDVSLTVIFAFLYISLYLHDRVGLYCEVRWEDVLSATPLKSLPMLLCWNHIVPPKLVTFALTQLA